MSTDMPKFTLRPVERPPVRPTSDIPPMPQRRQIVLFSGLNCCPGQLDLFPTDGRLPKEEQNKEGR